MSARDYIRGLNTALAICAGKPTAYGFAIGGEIKVAILIEEARQERITACMVRLDALLKRRHEADV